MIESIQQGFSKKNNKPYAMVTIEDLQGTAQVLCMNENYDKFRELLTPGRALMVTGEVNNEADRAQIFPVSIIPLEEAPRKYTQQVHVRLPAAHLDKKEMKALQVIGAAHPGITWWFFGV